MQTANLAFRILYNTLYYALYLVLLGVLIVSPADLMRQAVQHNNNTNILIIAASYLVTILVLLFVYAARLYINRSVLASIPKSWIPVDKSDGVPRRVREVIAGDLSRSAAVSWVARPRFEGPTGTGGSRLGTTGAVAGSHGHGHGGGSRGEDGLGGGIGKERNGKGLTVAVQHPPPERRVQRIMSRLRKSSWTGGGDEEKDIPAGEAAATDSVGIVPGLENPASPPVWGEIEHPGWASPTSPDLPNLQYNAVISELPNLIEAKALTLAPRDPESRTEPRALDPDAVAVLQRPETMGVREYLAHLTEIGVLAPAVVGPFMSMYEMARFSTRPMSNQQFRQLMRLFAEVLRGMQPLDPAVLLEEYDDDDEGADGENGYGSEIYDTDIDNDAPQGTSSSSGGEGEDGGSIHGPIITTTTTTNKKSNDDAKSRRGRKSTNLAETYNTTNNDNLNTTNFNFNINNTNSVNNKLSTRLPSSSSGNSVSTSSAASLSSQRRYSKRQSLAAPGTTGIGTPGRTTPSSTMLRNSSANTWHQQPQQQFRTAPTTPKSRRTVLTTRSGGSSRRSSSSRSSKSRSMHSGVSGDMDSFAQTRHPFILGGSSEGEGAGSGSGGDGSSMHSGGSGGSRSGGSVVIRLANGDEESVNGLPYVLGRSLMVAGT